MTNKAILSKTQVKGGEVIQKANDNGRDKLSKEIRYRCKYCKKELPQNHVGECPNCHQTEKEIIATMNETVNIPETQRRIMAYRKYARNWCVITIILDVVGLFLDTIWFGMPSNTFDFVIIKAVGLIFIVITTITGYWAVTKYKESSD